MSMPGFTAESALNRGRKRYALAVARNPAVVGEGVIPAAPPHFGAIWGNLVAVQHFICTAAGCWMGPDGNCHCYLPGF
jgi:hypothetical protein